MKVDPKHHHVVFVTDPEIPLPLNDTSYVSHVMHVSDTSFDATWYQARALLAALPKARSVSMVLISQQTVAHQRALVAMNRLFVYCDHGFIALLRPPEATGDTGVPSEFCLPTNFKDQRTLQAAVQATMQQLTTFHQQGYTLGYTRNERFSACPALFVIRPHAGIQSRHRPLYKKQHPRRRKVCLPPPYLALSTMPACMRGTAPRHVSATP